MRMYVYKYEIVYRLGLLLYSPACFLSIVNNHLFIRLKICMNDFDLITILNKKKPL